MSRNKPIRNTPGVRLNPRHQAVIDMWLNDLSKPPYRCWMDVYPNCKHPHAAKNSVGKLMSRPECQFYIEERQRKLKDRVDRTQADVAAELIHVGFATIGDLMSWDEEGNITFTASKDLSPAAMASISSVKAIIDESYDKDGMPRVKRRLEIKMHDKLQALQQFCAMMGFSPDSAQGDNVTNNIIVLPPLEDEADVLKRARIYDVETEPEA